MHIDKVLQQICRTADEIEFIQKIDEPCKLGFRCRGETIKAVFRSEEEREMLWQELSETPPMPFFQFRDSCVSARHIRLLKIEECAKNILAIILYFQDSSKITMYYRNSIPVLKKDYFALAQFLAQYQNSCATTTFYPTTRQ